MTTANSKRYFEGWPCQLARNEHKGRYLVAGEVLKEGDTVLVSEAMLSMILSSHKKRICAFCYRDGRRRLAACCGGCSQAYYCSPACQAAHASGPGEAPRLEEGLGHLSICDEASRGRIQESSDVAVAVETSQLGSTCHGGGSPMASLRDLAPRCAAMVPHVLLCGVLRQFGSAKWGADVESVLLGVLQLLAMEWVEGRQEQQQGQHQQQQQQGQQPGQHEEPQAGPRQQAEAELLRQQESEACACAAAAAEECEGAGCASGTPEQAAALPTRQPAQLPGGSNAAEPPAAAAPVAAAGAGVAGPSSSGHPPLPSLSHADFLQLQSHAADWDPEDRADWAKHAAQFVGMLRKAGWPGQLPTPELVLDYAGRITSNNFGIYGDRRPPQQAAQGELGQPAAGGEWREPGGVAAGAGAATAAKPSAAAAAAATAGPSALAGAAGAAQLPLQAAEQPPAREELIGRELYITASFFNHSCEPNCVVHRGYKTAQVVAQRDIQAGEELTISYIDLQLPRSARRAHLRKFFHFDCDCPRCGREAEEGSAPCSYGLSKGKTSAPKRRGRKARVSR